MKRRFALPLLVLPAFATAQSCRVDVTPIAFGVYDPSSPSASVARGDIVLVCSDTSKGDGVGSVAVRLGGEAARRLAGAGQMLRYSIFQDAASSRPWWSNAPLVAALPAAAGSGAAELHLPVYGRIAPGQWVAAGAYQDVVEVIVEF